jgi:hypothetical protein
MAQDTQVRDPAVNPHKFKRPPDIPSRIPQDAGYVQASRSGPWQRTYADSGPRCSPCRQARAGSARDACQPMNPVSVSK